MRVDFWAGGKIGATNSYDNASNWTPGGIPVPGDLIVDQNGQMTADNSVIGAQSTVWLDPAANGTAILSLVNASMAPNSFLLLNEPENGSAAVEVTLHNATLAGSTFVGSGVAAEDIEAGASGVFAAGSWLGVASVAGRAADVISTHGAFENDGVMQAGLNGDIILSIGWMLQGHQAALNGGVIQADPGGTVDVDSNEANGAYFGTLVNSGQINAAGGTVNLHADVMQTPGGVITITNGGTVDIGGRVDGTISIQSGMLDFSKGPSFSSGAGPATEAVFTGTIDIVGPTFKMAFDDVQGLSFSLDTTNDVLSLVGSYKEAPSAQFEQIHLSSALPLAATDFSVDGTTLLYLHHT